MSDLLATARGAADRREPGIEMIYVRPLQLARRTGAAYREPASTDWVDGPALLPLPVALAAVRDVVLVARLAQHAHQPVAPGWRCGRCSLPWPCAYACKDLVNDLGWTLVATYVAAMMERAAGDLTDVEPGYLWARFVGWTNPATVYGQV